VPRIAFSTCAVLREPYGHPAIEPFDDLTWRVYVTAERHPAFVCRADYADDRDDLADPERDWGSWGRLALPPGYLAQFGDGPYRAAQTLSVWRDLDGVRDFVYSDLHLTALQRRHEWFQPVGWPTYVVWWIGTVLPTGQDAADRVGGGGEGPRPAPGAARRRPVRAARPARPQRGGLRSASPVRRAGAARGVAAAGAAPAGRGGGRGRARGRRGGWGACAVRLTPPATGQELHAALPGLITGLRPLPAGASFGRDIDEAHQILLDPAAGPGRRTVALNQWLARSQPCLFGRLVARQQLGPDPAKGLGYDIVWIHEDEAATDPDAAATKVQLARRRWKERAEQGDTSAFLVMFHGPRLAAAKPGPDLVGLCRALAGLYLVECGGIETGVIYTESLPLRDVTGALALYKASTQLFYTGAHLMRNHDRRFPAGIAIVVNGPGHYARSLVRRGLYDEQDALQFTRKAAYRSVGNGGIGHPRRLVSSWHHAGRPDTPARQGRFCATYQVDVLVQADVVADGRPRLTGHDDQDVWPDLHLEYISDKPTPAGDPDFGWYNGLPVDEAAKDRNPWIPRRAENSPDFNY
jgi:hypothetical protein